MTCQLCNNTLYSVLTVGVHEMTFHSNSLFLFVCVTEKPTSRKRRVKQRPVKRSAKRARTEEAIASEVVNPSARTVCHCCQLCVVIQCLMLNSQV